MHLRPTAGFQISTLIFGFVGGGDPTATWGLNQKYCPGFYQPAVGLRCIIPPRHLSQ
jgi:hypothetical protein